MSSNNKIGSSFISNKIYKSSTTPWVRNPTWLALPTLIASNQQVSLLHAVYENANFVSFIVAAAYTVNWGDGVTENFGPGVQCYHEYDFTDADLANTNGPVTFTDSGDLITRNNHGYTNGQTISFASITSTTGIIAKTIYYVINATTNTFQVSATLGGSALTLTTDGTGNILPYKQAIITITPQAGANLTSVQLHAKHNQATLQVYNSGILDIVIAGQNITQFTVGVAAAGFSSKTINMSSLESVNIVSLGAITSFSYLFYQCYSLQNVIISSSNSSMVNTSFMFAACANLKILPLFNTSAVALMNSMFSTCFSLKTIPVFNTISVTTMNGMFNNCRALISVPLLNTVAVTDMSSMFSNCFSLKTVPLFNTTSVTNMTSMFATCESLPTVPLFNINTISAVNMTSMFSNCYSLQTVPLFNTIKVTNMTSMFSSCSSLTSVPLFNTVAVILMTSMFSGCYSLTSVPLFNTAAVTNMTSMFSSCSLLKSVPLFNTALVTNMTSMFNFCRSLTSVPLFNTAAVTNMSSMFSSCFSLTSVPLFNTALVTNMTSMFNFCSSLTEVPAFSVAATTASSAHTNIVNACVNLSRFRMAPKFTFSVASCKLSATQLNAIYTALPTVTAQTITVTGNYGTTSDDPTIATAKGWTVTG